MSVVIKKASLFLLVTATALLLALIYKAYVVNRPCGHKLKKLDAADRFKLGDESITRLRNALTFPTVSFAENNQNETALNEYVNFVRRGIFLISVANYFN
jgi:hypothetical protein